MPENRQPASNRKRYYLQLTGRGVAGLFLVIFGISGWMFWLGLQVGMENAPVRFDIAKLEKELASLRDAVDRGKQKIFNSSPEASAQRPELKFYEILKDPKPDAVQIQVEANNLKPEPPEIAKVPKPPPPEIAKAPKPPPAAVAKPALETVRQVPAQQTPSVSASGMSYTIQVASLRTFEDADQMVKRLQKKGYPSFQTAIDIAGKGRWYRVRVGSFKDRTEAQKTMERLKNDKFQTMLVKL
ncbi:MAG: SPOR domain-containing protein [Desulfobacterales bacterium]|nr:SPOR domain-containing protein [Desulfobacterales bacterium]MDD3082562.1 SPOR domain-containing protein [Desulfobacterales bacterium]MDD3951603.1 SPOR domain-containing protein [Desulfobacterales bacterium]MDD4462930.1 SPOR domain-containing protein [Desulfobacterales bacterium]